MPTTTRSAVPLGDHERYGPISAFVLVAVGTVLLAVAAEESRLWWLLLWFTLGVVFLAMSLLYLNDELAERIGHLASVPTGWWVLFGSIAGAGLLGLYGLVRADGSSVLGALCVLLIAVGMIGVFVGLSHGEADDPPASTDPWYEAVAVPVWISAAVMLVTAVVIGLVPGFGWIDWVLASVWVVGLILMKIHVAGYLISRAERPWPTLGAMVALTLAGMGLIVVGAVSSTLLWVLLGVTAAIGALSVLGLMLVHCHCHGATRWWLLGAGAAGVIGGTIWTVVVVHGAGLGIVVAAFVWGIGTWYVFRGEGIVLVLLLGWIAVWGLVERTADVDANPNPGDDVAVQMLAIGDSFISGEGAEKFLAGTDFVGGDTPNECRRAPTAYPYLVAAEQGYSLDFVACSGAKMDDLTVCAQAATPAVMGRYGFGTGVADPYRDRCTTSEGAWEPFRASRGDEPAGYLPQLANFTEAEFDEFDVVLLSIGGNDSGFATIVKSCLLPQDCSEQEPEWTARVLSQGTALRATYAHVKQLVGDDTPIVVMPYPRIVGGQACGLGLSASEHKFVADFIDLLAREVEEAAADAGVNFFAQNLVAFDGIQLCDDKKGANHLKLEPTEGVWNERYQPGKWIHGSMHPNERGHRAIADLLAPYVEELLAKPAAERNPQPGDGNVPVLTPEQQRLADRAEQLLADRQWIVDEGYETVWRLIAPLILLLFSGIVLAAGVLRFDFFLANALRSGDAPDPDDGDHDDGGDGDHGGGGDG